jgi:hypothetical protein
MARRGRMRIDRRKNIPHGVLTRNASTVPIKPPAINSKNPKRAKIA